MFSDHEIVYTFSLLRIPRKEKGGWKGKRHTERQKERQRLRDRERHTQGGKSKL